MFTKLLNILHRYPVSSIGLMFAVGMVLIFGNTVYLSHKINQKLAMKYVETKVAWIQP
jgi:Tfp pilus assembly protein PilZ